jgi:hypothetical protein
VNPVPSDTSATGNVGSGTSTPAGTAPGR